MFVRVLNMPLHQISFKKNLSDIYSINENKKSVMTEKEEYCKKKL